MSSVRKPRLTRKRINGLIEMHTMIAPRANIRVSTSNLYALPRDSAAKIRAALQFIRDLKTWSDAK